MRYIIALANLLVISNCSYAYNDVANTQTHNTVTQNTTVHTSKIDTAKDWHLTDTEWQQYIELMKGTNGHYYKQLTPPEVLGINADTPNDLRHYAEVAAKLAHARLLRELRFNTEFHEAAVRLYAKEPIIHPFDFTPFTPLHHEQP